MFCPIQGAKSEASATARVINWQTREGPKAGTFTPRLRPLSLPPAPLPRYFTATAQFRCCRRSTSLSRHRPASPAPLLARPERAIVVYRASAATAAATDGYKRRTSARLIRRRASILLRDPRSTGDHVLLDPTCNMAHPRCSTKFSQGMRRHRCANFFCYFFLFTTSSSEVILCIL
jgi:hypothetical protein